MLNDQSPDIGPEPGIGNGSRASDELPCQPEGRAGAKPQVSFEQRLVLVAERRAEGARGQGNR